MGLTKREADYSVPTYREALTQRPAREENPLDKFSTLYNSHLKMLREKNKRYGDSALDPLNIFGEHITPDSPSVNGILIRLDDKLSRVKNADELRKNDISDIIGYLMLLSLAKEWDDFEDQID